MAFKSAKLMPPSLKVLAIGPTGTGKTLGLLKMPGRLAALDGEDGLRPYRKSFDFDYDTFDSIDDVNSKLGDLLNDASELQKYNTIGVDGFTVAWHAALADGEDDKGNIAFSNQRHIKAGFKEFNGLVFRAGKANKNVFVNAQAKADWDTSTKVPRLKGQKADMDPRIWYAFDLVLYLDVVDGVRIARVLKTRYPRLFPMGETIEDFDIRTAFAPILSGDEVPTPESENPIDLEMKRGREQIKELLTTLSSKNGGPVDSAETVGIWQKSRDATQPEVLGAILHDLRERLTTHEAKVANAAEAAGVV